MKVILGKIGGFTIASLLSSAIALLVVPVVIGVAGAESWATVAVGQAAGTIASTLLAMGWGFNGPAVTAMTPVKDRPALAANSLIARGVTAPFILGVACAASALLRPSEALIAVLACVVSAFPGLNMNWLFVGAGNVRLLVLTDTVPRVLGSILGLGVLLLSGHLVLFLLVQAVAAVVSILIASSLALRGLSRVVRTDWGFSPAAKLSRTQAAAGVTVFTAASYLALPTLIVAALSPSSVFAYALAEKISRYSLIGITPIYQWMQGWVPGSPIDSDVIRRMSISLKISLIIAGIAAILVSFLSPMAAEFLGAEPGVLSYSLAVPMAVMVAMSAMSRCTGPVCLVAFRRERVIAFSAVSGALVGVPLLLILVPPLGAIGAALAVMASETVVVVIQASALRVSLRIWKKSAVSSGSARHRADASRDVSPG